MSSEGPLDRLEGRVTGVVSMLVTGIWLAALFLDQDWWLAFMLFGYVVIVPLTAMLTGEDEEAEGESGTRDEDDTTSRSDETDEALATLRERYARDELTEAEFERKVERLLETEDPETARDLVGEPDESRGVERERSRE